MKPFFAFLFFTNTLFGQAWFRIGDFPALKRDDGVAVTVNNKAYFGTGLIEWAAMNDFYELDVATLGWTTIPTLPATKERQYACAFAGPGCFYVFGGDGVGGALNDLYKYTISTSSWTAVGSKPGNGLIGAVCMNFGDRVIISGGKFQSGQVSDEVWEYTISTDSWIQKSNFPFSGRWRASATVLGNYGYMIFGRDNNGSYRKELYKYSPANDNWQKIMDFPSPQGRAYSSLHVANNKLFVFGGHDTLGQYYKDIWYFNETTGTWLQGPDIPSTGRRGGMSCTFGDKFFYTCGLGQNGRLTETWMTDVPVSLKETDFENTFSVYPNPANTSVHFDFHTEIPLKLSCRYTDAYGRELGMLEHVDHSTVLDLSNFSGGLYILRFYSENKWIGSKRIIKE